MNIDFFSALCCIVVWHPMHFQLLCNNSEVLFMFVFFSPFWYVILSMLALDFYCFLFFFFFFEWVLEISSPWFHPFFTWCLGQSVHNENLMRNLKQSRVILTLSYHSTDLILQIVHFITENVSVLLSFLFFCSLLPYFQLDYMNLDPPASPLHKIFVYYLHFESETSHFTVISSFIIVILWLVWICGNALKETFGRWTWYWKCPFPSVLKLCQSDHLSISVCLHGGAQLCPF